MAVKKGTYKVDNGSGFDEIMLKTLAEQINFKNGKNLEAGFVCRKDVNGYQSFPSGIILQWGSFRIPPMSMNGIKGQIINLPIAFPNKILNISLTLSHHNVATKEIISDLSTAGDANSNSTIGVRWRCRGDLGEGMAAIDYTVIGY